MRNPRAPMTVKASYLIARARVGDARPLNAYARGLPKQCAHGRIWDAPCPECDAIWRAECIARLERQAAEYGFRLVPIAKMKP